jgi:hypothetical protein
MYLNESSAAFDNNAGRVPFNFEIAYQKMKQLRDRINFWEQKRMEIMQR